MKNFVKGLGKSNSNGFAFFCNRFPRISESKIKKSIFVGPQIWKVLKDLNLKKSLTAIERHVWKMFEWLCVKFLSNTILLLLRSEHLRTHLKDHRKCDQGPEIHGEPRRVSFPVGEAQLAACLRVRVSGPLVWDAGIQ